MSNRVFQGIIHQMKDTVDVYKRQVLSYTPNEQVGQLLSRLDKTGALIAVKTGDPGLTVSRLSLIHI